MDGDVGDYLRGLAGKLDLHALDKMWDNGFRQITSSTHPINDARRPQGLKIRVPVSPMWTSLFKALGASPTGINFSEVYSALQTQIVDGAGEPVDADRGREAVRGAEVLLASPTTCGTATTS